MIYYWIMANSSELYQLIPWEGPAIGLLDLDAFFASVEQMDNPQWRGKPLIVGGRSQTRGVVAAASYEARRFGIHSAMPAMEAEKRCPQAIWVRGRMDRYREISDQVIAIIRKETPFIQPISIDEAFFDISPGAFTGDHPVLIAKRIQDMVRELGLTCSIGLSTTKTVSKIASDLDKPDGLTIIFPGSEETFLSPRNIRDLSGIGPKAEQRLNAIGIKTLGQLAQASDATLQKHLGSNGPLFKLRAQGRENSPIKLDEPVKSISNERTFVEDLTDTQEVESAVLFLGEKVAGRLRAHNLRAHTLTLKVRFDLQTTRTAQLRVAKGLDDIESMKPLLLDLLARLWTPPTPIRLIGVGGKDFEEEDVQLDLFEEMDQEQQKKRPRTAEALDGIRKRFGAEKLMLGSELLSKAHLGDSVSSYQEHRDEDDVTDESHSGT